MEFKKLGDFAKLKKGKNNIKKEKMVGTLYPVYSGSTINNGEIGRMDCYDYDGEYITYTADGYAGKPFYRNEKFSINSHCGIIIQNEIDNRFLYHYLNCHLHKYAKETGRANFSTLNIKDVAEIPIPILHLEEQKRIAGFLTKLSELTENIEKGITALIKKTKKQYDYYLKKLMSFEDAESKKLGDFAKLKKGKNNIKKEKMVGTLYPVYSGSTINNGEIGRMDCYDYDGEYITYTADGYAGKPFYRNEKFSINSHCGIIIQNEIDNRFLYHYLNCHLHKYAKETGRANFSTLNIKDVSNIMIPILPLEEQKRIADFLTQKQQLTQQLTQQLKLCKKQYQYYLNKLMTFE